MNLREGQEAGCGCCMPRRGFLAAMAGGAVAASAVAGRANAAPSGRNIVDVHAHFTPPDFRAADLAGGPMGPWSVERHLEAMDKAGVARSVLSVTTPGVPIPGDRGRALTRGANEYAARIAGEQKGRLGFFTYVRDPTETDDALREIAYGFDTLKANGVGLFTSYAGKYLGDPVFDPVFAELNRRKAIVYVHPTGAACCGRLIPAIPDTIVEFGTDTTRAITSYVYRGAARRFPDVTMIWSHSGGTMPYLIERYDNLDKTAAIKASNPDGFRAEIARFYFDVAQASNPVATGALRQVVPMQQIVFGTDYPYRTPLEHVTLLEDGRVFSRAELAELYRGNVARGLPGLLI